MEAESERMREEKIRGERIEEMEAGSERMREEKIDERSVE